MFLGFYKGVVMDLYGFSWSVVILWLCCFLYVGLNINDALYGFYFSVIYVFVELLLLIRQYYRKG